MNSLQGIIKLHGEAYTKSKKLPSNILKALYSIKDCRTAALGDHVYECDECGETKISYNACRNRHCPKCQAYAKEMPGCYKICLKEHTKVVLEMLHV